MGDGVMVSGAIKRGWLRDMKLVNKGEMLSFRSVDHFGRSCKRIDEIRYDCMTYEQRHQYRAKVEQLISVVPDEPVKGLLTVMDQI